MAHKSVLLKEVFDGLDLKDCDVFVDCTLNGGGHSEEALKRGGKNIKVIGIDLDEDAISRAKDRLSKIGGNFFLKQDSFRNLDKVLKEFGFQKADKILFDLGWSSNQMEEGGRGMSFQKNEPLLMTFKKNPEETDLTARDIVNSWDEENIATILKSYGEERFAEKIARKIVEEREKKPIETAFELASIILRTVRPKGKIHPATKTFQALRIAVNDEIGALKEGLEKAFDSLGGGGRMAVISFHSLEDRIVKNFFRKRKNNGEAETLSKKPIVPSREEILENPRSRSAKLRIIEKK